MNPSAPLCDADNLATWMFKWTFAVLALGTATLFLSNTYNVAKEISRKKKTYKEHARRINIILTEIEHLQALSKEQYKNAKSEYAKANALYAYEQVNSCLSNFKTIEIVKGENDESKDN